MDSGAKRSQRDSLRLQVIELTWRVSDMLREPAVAAVAKVNLFENCHRHHAEGRRGPGRLTLAKSKM